MLPEKVIHIREKLEEIGMPVESLSLGDFSYIGKYTAEKMREPQSELWRTVGSHFMPNLERGLLIYSLIKKYNLSSYLEVGFGRGFSALCAAKAFVDLGNDGKVSVIEPSIDDNHMNMIAQVFPQEWTSRIHVSKGLSSDILPKLQDKYDLVYLDGDHTQSVVASDWETSKNLWKYFYLFDDWHMDKGMDPGIQVHEALENVEQPKDIRCELIKSDRRIFMDDRRWPDDKIRYGQLLLTNDAEVAKLGKEVSFKETWDW